MDFRPEDEFLNSRDPKVLNDSDIKIIEERLRKANNNLDQMIEKRKNEHIQSQKSTFEEIFKEVLSTLYKNHPKAGQISMETMFAKARI